jgi:sensor histidine kinase YesM
MRQELIKEIFIILASASMLALSVYLLSIFSRLFSFVKNKWLRKNLAVMVVAVSFMLTIMGLSPIVRNAMLSHGWVNILIDQAIKSVFISLFVYNCFYLVNSLAPVKKLSFVRYHSLVIITIIISSFASYALMYYFGPGDNYGGSITEALLQAFYNATAAGLIYASVNYLELERKKKLDEKELELSRLRELKTKAELDALHSKINPHFLYNALNSIADLSVTDGKKGRKMTIALADLFRYSINYSDNNYSSVKEELAMTEVYLQIEKIRFEDQLNYSIKMEAETEHYLIPRFLLQPLVENAVKHGLKATGKMTEILLEAKMDGGGLLINIIDNGPLFPDELNPGYGVKSVFDKLDLLFPDQYAIQFTNEPRKQVSLHINKLIKNAPGV